MTRQTIHVTYKGCTCECSYPVQRLKCEVDAFTFDRAWDGFGDLPLSDFTPDEQEGIIWMAYDKYMDHDNWGVPNEPNLIDREG